MTQFIDTLVGIFQSSGFARFGEPGGYDDEFSDEICALKAKACLMVAREYSGSDSATDLQKAIDLAKQASELSKRGIFADESVKSKADELLKAKAKRLSDYYRSLL